MVQSHVIRMPELTQLVISEKQRLIPVKDEQIFRELRNQYRQIEDQQDGAAKGDYVLIDITDSRGVTKTLHIELGGKCYPEIEPALLGCKTGQELQVRDTAIRVRSVRKVVEYPLTDASIAALQIPGVATLIQYRKQYLQAHGEEIADRVFGAIQPRLLGDILKMTEIHMDEGEMAHYHEQQCVMLQNISGDIEDRLRRGYGDDGANSLEECYRLFFEDNKKAFAKYLLGKAMAEQDQVTPTAEEYRQALEYYCLMFEKTEVQVQQEGLTEEALRSFYVQYGIKRIRDYYHSIVRFCAEGISSQPLNT